MTKKDYIVIAEALSIAFDTSSLTRTQMDGIVKTMCRQMKYHNSRFDESKFTEAVFGKE